MDFDTWYNLVGQGTYGSREAAQSAYDTLFGPNGTASLRNPTTQGSDQIISGSIGSQPFDSDVTMTAPVGTAPTAERQPIYNPNTGLRITDPSEVLGGIGPNDQGSGGFNSMGNRVSLSGAAGGPDAKMPFFSDPQSIVSTLLGPSLESIPLPNQADLKEQLGTSLATGLFAPVPTDDDPLLTEEPDFDKILGRIMEQAVSQATTGSGDTVGKLQILRDIFDSVSGALGSKATRVVDIAIDILNGVEIIGTDPTTGFPTVVIDDTLRDIFKDPFGTGTSGGGEGDYSDIIGAVLGTGGAIALEPDDPNETDPDLTGETPIVPEEPVEPQQPQGPVAGPEVTMEEPEPYVPVRPDETGTQDPVVPQGPGAGGDDYVSPNLEEPDEIIVPVGNEEDPLEPTPDGDNEPIDDDTPVVPPPTASTPPPSGGGGTGGFGIPKASGLISNLQNDDIAVTRIRNISPTPQLGMPQFTDYLKRLMET